jgi:hypothetical protein
MRYIRTTVPSVPIAILHAWSNAEDGDGVGTPYMVLDRIDGKTLEWNANVPPPAARRKVLAQLSQYIADFLARTPLQSSPQSTLSWVLRRTDSRLIRMLTGDLRAFDPIDCLIYWAMTEEKYFVPPLASWFSDLEWSGLGAGRGYRF